MLAMERIGGTVRLSATDLVGHLNCGHLTGLDLDVAKGALEKPKVWDPLLEILWERGTRHEKGFVDHLKAKGLAATVIEGVGIDADAVARTRAAMADGAPIIVQGAFQTDRWVGRTDVLQRALCVRYSVGVMSRSCARRRPVPFAAASKRCRSPTCDAAARSTPKQSRYMAMLLMAGTRWTWCRWTIRRWTWLWLTRSTASRSAGHG